MFLVSGVELVSACCNSGLIGSFPALNARTTDDLDKWLTQIQSVVGERPYAVNLIVHPSNQRLAQDLECLERHRVPMVITSLGAVDSLVQRVHAWGGLVYHDVTNAKHAAKAVAAGVDGLIAVSTGAGGHAGAAHPFALMVELQQMTNKPILLAGAMSRGREIRAAQALGAQGGYIGTRFIATHESMADAAYKDCLVASKAGDVVYTDQVSGVPGNFIRQSLVDAGIDPDVAGGKSVDLHTNTAESEAKAWKNIWSAGHGVGGIGAVQSAADVIDELEQDFLASAGAP